MSSEETKTSPSKPRRVLLGLAEYRRSRTTGRMRLRPRWGALAIVFGALCVLALVAKTGFVYYRMHTRMKFEEVTLWQSLIWPIGRHEMSQRLGDHQIDVGLQAAKAGNYQQALFYLANGLARAPGNLEGRLTLAEFYRLMSRQELSLRLLREGLAYQGDNPEYLKQYIRVLITDRKDDELSEFASTRLQDLGHGDPTVPEQIIAYGAAQILMLHGQFDTAERYIKEAKLADSPDGAALLGNIEWLRGNREKSVQDLEAFVNRAGRRPAEAVYDLLCRHLRELDRPDEALRYALLRTTDNPKSSAARLELIRCYLDVDRQRRVDDEVTSYLRDFGDEEGAMLQLANLAADKGQLEMGRRVYERAAENGFNMGAFGMLYIEGHLVAHEFKKAALFCDQLKQEGPAWIDRYAGQFNFLRCVAAQALHQTEMAQLYRGRMLQQKLTPSELIAMARRYRSIDMDAEARAALQQALKLQPNNELALASLVEVDLDNNETGNLPEYARDLLPMRRPSYKLMARLRDRLTSDTFIFEPHRGQLLASLDKVLQEPAKL